MYRLFTQPSKSSRGLLSLPRFTYVRQGVERNAKRLIAYARTNPMAVRSDHILMQLLQSLTVPITYDTADYYRIVSKQADELSQAMGFTTGKSYGKVLSGSDFYGKHYKEIIVSLDDKTGILPPNLPNWEDWTPVTVLKHDVTSYMTELLDGSDDSREGVSVIQIDIALLALQYRAFRLREMKKPPEETQLTLAHFVMTYPIANMIWSHLDYSSFNFYLAVMDGQTYDEFREKNSFYTTNYDEKAMECYSQVADAFEKREYDWQDFFKQIPAISADNQWDALKLPVVPGTRQLEWSLIYARLPAISTYFYTNFQHGLNNSRMEGRRVTRSIRQIKNDNSVRNLLPRELYAEFSGTVLALQDIL